MPKSVALVLAAIALMASAARPAELPTMKAKRPENARVCRIGGMTGLILPGSNMCVKLSGYISGGVEAGSVRH